MAKKTFNHVDKIGNPLDVGDCVVYPRHNSLAIGRITKLNEKMLRVASFNERSREFSPHGDLKYPVDMCKVESEQVTFYLLKNGSK